MRKHLARAFALSALLLLTVILPACSSWDGSSDVYVGVGVYGGYPYGGYGGYGGYRGYYAPGWSGGCCYGSPGVIVVSPPIYGPRPYPY